MKKEYEPLFTPWKIGNVEIPNRIVQTSMGGTSLFGWLEPCHFDKEAAHHILGRAQDGVGLVLPGMQCVRDTMGRRWLYQNKKMFKDLAEWMPEFHKTGSKLFIQLAGGFGRSMASGCLNSTRQDPSCSSSSQADSDVRWPSMICSLKCLRTRLSVLFRNRS